jgi:hypothetical protein
MVMLHTGHILDIFGTGIVAVNCLLKYTENENIVCKQACMFVSVKWLKELWTALSLEVDDLTKTSR